MMPQYFHFLIKIEIELIILGLKSLQSMKLPRCPQLFSYIWAMYHTNFWKVLAERNFLKIFESLNWITENNLFTEVSILNDIMVKSHIRGGKIPFPFIWCQEYSHLFFYGKPSLLNFSLCFASFYPDICILLSYGFTVKYLPG